MEQKLQKLVQEVNLRSLQIQISLQCAPVLLAIKVSNTLIVDPIYKKAVRCIFYKSRIRMLLLYENKERVAFLVYHPRLLKNYLNQGKIKKQFWENGYDHMDLAHLLPEFVDRYRLYMEGKGAFPHEMGLLLGYPVQDVKGFIENKGKNFLYSGYWKVYGNVDEAMKMFLRYDKAKQLILAWISRGGSIRSILLLDIG